MRPLRVGGLAAAAVKIQWDSAVVDLGCNVHRVERNARGVRRDGVDHHLILYQIAGQSALTQNDQAVRLAVGDVALVDATAHSHTPSVPSPARGLPAASRP